MLFRSGGYVFVGMGLCMLASLAAPHSTAAAALAAGSAVGGVAYLLVYSHLEFKKTAG